MCWQWKATMARKHAKRFFKPQSFDYKQSIFNGLVWSIPSSRGDSTYSIQLSDLGFECDCPGFGFRGTCKHVSGVLTRIEEAIDGRVPQYKWV